MWGNSSLLRNGTCCLVTSVLKDVLSPRSGVWMEHLGNEKDSHFGRGRKRLCASRSTLSCRAQGSPLRRPVSI